ncbi:YdaS family helix-turn-helix protein [Variovorax sp. IB41]|uniref:YdaS family helix-turn-helix protein n=1 Tax=Variovorax sp. IB41 TaxID=2779370 RepID=UPI0018E74B58|nr:YdaS family helix-turn-helix protein [Variovorax sp. IB41]MBJ2155283.1 helix-turn-helix domain-containing protein [Variovorax sp. IB41]
MEAFLRAIEIAGSRLRLAELIGVASSTPGMWAFRKKVPAEHCPAIERETGVRCEELRPDVPWEVLRNSSKRRSPRKSVVAA